MRYQANPALSTRLWEITKMIIAIVAESQHYKRNKYYLK
jgi:hypothetical protein